MNKNAKKRTKTKNNFHFWTIKTKLIFIFLGIFVRKMIKNDNNLQF